MSDRKYAALHQLASRLFLLAGLFLSVNAFAAQRVVNFIVGYKTVNFTGTPVKAIAVNNQIPGPTLHFKEGDSVTINVYNHLDKGTTIHWHGLIVPWQMDGVAGVSQKPIAPGGVYHYQFTLHQAGTYWYHAHKGLQEQQGLYGAIIIDPPHTPYHYNKDFVMVLSDWSNTNPDQIFANLKKSGDYYSSKFPLQSSLKDFLTAYHHASTEAEKQKILDVYHATQKMRMGVYDISDVAYDTFLLNGHPPFCPWQGIVKPGDIVRLRFIGAGASTYFHIKIPKTTMQVIQVDGNAVKPLTVNDLKIGPGETYDVLVHIKTAAPYIIYAESADKVGAAYGALVTAPNQALNYHEVKPFPAPTPQEMAMMPMSHGSHGNSSSMSGMAMDNNSPSAAKTSSSTKYQALVSPVKTNNPNLPFHVINMVLSGDMNNYIWFINGVPEYKAKPVIIEAGKRYRIIFTNKSLMNHPMHIHGHWFILRNGHGAYDPLLHTVDVPPFATVVVDFDADNAGRWYMHCHNLYHLVAGMARVFEYKSLADKTNAQPVSPAIDNNASYEKAMTANRPYLLVTAHELAIPVPEHKPTWYATNTLEFGGGAPSGFYEFSYESLIGYNENKLQLNAEDADIENNKLSDANLDIFYWHLISPFWALKGGANYVYRPAETPYWQPGVGIEGTMPYSIDTDARAYLHAGSTKLDLLLSRDTQLSGKFFLKTQIRSILATKTLNNKDEIGSGLNSIDYTVQPYIQLTPAVALFVAYDHTDYYGALKKIRAQENESSNDNTLQLGLSLLF